MTGRSKIEWTGHSWNPTTGCGKVSSGCRNCYAATMAEWLREMGTPGYENGFSLTLHPERLDAPLKRKKPTLWFVNSMSDLFHEDVPVDFIDRVFETIKAAPQHRFQILTKRPARMEEYFRSRAVRDNVWLGVSVENRKHGVPRIAVLQRIAAANRFLSIEPLLENIGRLDLTGISWVIVGGESGSSAARPMHPEWARSIRDQCLRAGVGFFFKQWGSWLPMKQDDAWGRRWMLMYPDGDVDVPHFRVPDFENGELPIRYVKKKSAHRKLDGRIWNEQPEDLKEIMNDAP